MRPTRAGTRWSALVTLVIATFVSACLVSLFSPPASWTEPSGSNATVSLLTRLSNVLADLLPLGDVTTRPTVAARMWLIALSGATAWCAYHLYRGYGRPLAAISAAMIVALATSTWSLEVTHPPTTELAFAVFAVLTLSALVRPLVHLGKVTAPSAARALASASACAIACPLPGALLAAAVIGVGLTRAQRRHGRWRPASWGWLVGLAPALLFWLGMVAVDETRAAMPSEVRLAVALPDLAKLRRFVDIHLLYPALAFVGLLVMPLRWRGGVTVLTLLSGALFLRHNDELLVPLPALLACLSIAAAGWVWLAGSATRHRGGAVTLSALTTLLVLAFATAPTLPHTSARPRAHTPSHGLVMREYLRALSVPGDVFITHDPVLADELWREQALFGVRPDMLVVDASRPPTSEIPGPADSRWRTMGRRVLSDSFDRGGEWDPSWVIEMGAAFWFVFDGMLASEHAVSDPLPEHESWVGLERLRWDRVRLEHARYRRAVGRELDAFAVLPLSPEERRSLRASAQVARAVRLTAEHETQLRLPVPFELTQVTAASYAETGDLLYESGEHELGLALLQRAIDLDYSPALAAVCRWQLLAGMEESVQQLLADFHDPRGAQRVTVELVHWLLARDETAAARHLLQATEGTEQTPAELSARLRLLTVQAQRLVRKSSTPDSD